MRDNLRQNSADCKDYKVWIVVLNEMTALRVYDERPLGGERQTTGPVYFYV